MKRHIPILLEIGDCFDLLSIDTLKYNTAKETKLKNELGDRIRELELRITKGIGFKSFQEILRSVEYNNLYESNQKIFEAVNVAKKDPDGKLVTGYQLDKLNINRNKAKKALNYKFLGKESEEIRLDGEGKKVD